MGTINIYSSNGANKAGLTYNGSGDITVDTEHLANTSSGVQSQLDAKLPLAGGTMTGEVTNTNTFKALSTSSGDYVRMYGGTGTGKWDIYGNGANLRFSDNESAGAVVIDTNVGIGTTSPSDKLEVSRTSTDQTVGLTLTNLQAGGYGSGIVWKSRRSDAPNNILDAAKIVVTGENSWNSDGNTASQMQFWTQKDNTLTKHMTLNKNGNLGIGTASPGRLLTLFNNDQPVFQITNNTSGLASTNGMIFYQASGSTTHNIDNQGSGSGGDIQFMAAGSNTLKIQANGNVGIGTTSPSAKLTINADAGDLPALVLGNVDGGGIAYVHRNNRYLTSNGSNWLVDGRDPIAVIGTNSNSTDKFPSNGLVMHNESQTDNTFSTPIMFGNRSNSGAYNTAYAYIAGRKVGQGVDPNWSTGEIWIDTAGTKHNGNDAYMDHSPAIKIRNTGTVDMRWQPFSYGTLGGNNLTNGTGWTLSPVVTQGLSYNNNASHGYGLTVAEPGYYLCYGTSLYTPGANGYVYIGWAINGSQIHHWHSNHGIESNHDWVSSIIRWCNAGDHITIENSSASVASQWGGGHSQYYVWKVG